VKETRKYRRQHRITVACVDMIKETMTSHRRIAVTQAMGRGSGYLAEQVTLPLVLTSIGVKAQAKTKTGQGV
jgi:6-phosphofructokinase